MRTRETRAKRAVLLVVLVAAVIAPLVAPSLRADAAGPAINIWYGANQQFVGRPQKWIDILGNIAMPATASFTLNGVNKGAH